MFATKSSAQTAGQFTNVSATNLPALGAATEAAKFADLDLDGDLDLVYANGGDANNQQSRVLFNRGLAQAGGGALGAIGTYLDRTTTNLTPNFTQSSRDVQIVDLDNDGDFDFYFSNHSQAVNQSNTWFINQGQAQGGAAGVFVRDMSRWVGLGAAGSSVPGALVINSGNFAGGFVDWSCQCDFADVDFDGDMDLFHTSYGSGFNALVMSRLYLNGFGTTLGSFKEYNPSNAVSGNPNLAAGSAAGFAEGVQQNNTANTTGLEHDITNMSLDADFSDMDGDFDLDIYANSRDTRQRFYQSRFFENGGNLGNGTTTRLYRDVTNAWAPGLTDASSNYDGDLNDMDLDNDTDLYALNGLAGFTDGWLLNNGTGALGANNTVPSSGADDNEIDWLDYNNDGDVDVYISAFASPDKFYRNQFVETASVNLALVSGVISGTTPSRSLAADPGDMDNDGDLDIIVAEDAGIDEVLLRNNINVPDPIAPRVPGLIPLAGGPATSAPRVVLARAYDNANQEYFEHGTGVLNFTVNGSPKTAPLKYAGGNVWRGVIPGYWFGTIQYSVAITDRKGNTGNSITRTVNVTSTGLSNFGTSTPGCAGAHAISGNSAPTIGNTEFVVNVTNCPPSTTQLLLASNSQGVGGDPFGLGLTNGMWVDLFFATEVYALDLFVNGGGLGSTAITIPNVSGLIGVNYYMQGIIVNFACSLPPFNISGSNGLQLTIQG